MSQTPQHVPNYPTAVHCKSQGTNQVFGGVAEETWGVDMIESRISDGGHCRFKMAAEVGLAKGPRGEVDLDLWKALPQPVYILPKPTRNKVGLEKAKNPRWIWKNALFFFCIISPVIRGGDRPLVILHVAKRVGPLWTKPCWPSCKKRQKRGGGWR